MYYFPSKRLVLCLVLLCLCIAGAVAQTETNARVGIDETQIVLVSPDADVASGESATGANRSSNIWFLVRLVLVLVLICAGAYGALHLIRKSGKVSASADQFLANPSGLQLGPNQSVQVVTIGDKALLLGVTDSSINLLCELDDRELIDSLKLFSGKTEAFPGSSFSSILAKFIPRSVVQQSQNSSAKPVNQADMPNDAAATAQATADFIKKQRERLKKAGQEESSGDNRL